MSDYDDLPLADGKMRPGDGKLPAQRRMLVSSGAGTGSRTSCRRSIQLYTGFLLGHWGIFASILPMTLRGVRLQFLPGLLRN